MRMQPKEDITLPQGLVSHELLYINCNCAQDGPHKDPGELCALSCGKPDLPSSENDVLQSTAIPPIELRIGSTSAIERILRASS